MNLFLISMLFKDTNKKIGVLIISLVKTFTHIHISLSFVVKMDNNNFIATMLCFEKTLKSLHFNKKTSFLVNANNNRTKFTQTLS